MFIILKFSNFQNFSELSVNNFVILKFLNFQNFSEFPKFRILNFRKFWRLPEIILKVGKIKNSERFRIGKILKLSEKLKFSEFSKFSEFFKNPKFCKKFWKILKDFQKFWKLSKRASVESTYLQIKFEFLVEWIYLYAFWTGTMRYLPILKRHFGRHFGNFFRIFRVFFCMGIVFGPKVGRLAHCAAVIAFLPKYFKGFCIPFFAFLE